MGTNDLTKLHLGRDPLLDSPTRYHVVRLTRLRRRIAYADVGNSFGLSRLPPET
jgi:hypothetical protein